MKPILITGVPRSGTSLMAGLINLSGVWGGDLIGASIYNAKGMFENHELRERLVKPYLSGLGCDPKGQYPIPKRNVLVIKNWRDQVLGILQKQGLKDQRWFYKGAKMALHWQVWHEAFPEAQWIIVRRNDQDIINSCLRTGFMNAYARDHVLKKINAEDEQAGWLWWINQHKKRFADMHAAGLDIKQIWPEKLVQEESYTELDELFKWLGLPYKHDDVQEFIEPKLWKQKQKGKR
jgi:hypothetical protein